jgi:hypothetical protein
MNLLDEYCCQKALHVSVSVPSLHDSALHRSIAGQNSRDNRSTESEIDWYCVNQFSLLMSSLHNQTHVSLYLLTPPLHRMTAPGKQFSMETAPWKLTEEMVEVRTYRHTSSAAYLHEWTCVRVRTLRLIPCFYLTPCLTVSLLVSVVQGHGWSSIFIFH